MHPKRFKKSAAIRQHDSNIALHLKLFKNIDETRNLIFRLELYICWVTQAVGIVNAVLRALAKPNIKPNFNRLMEPIIKIIQQLYTFHTVLQILQENFFNGEFYSEYADVFASARNADTSRVAHLLIDEYLPPRLLIIKAQWQEGSLLTEIPPKGILELCVECICTSLSPLAYTPGKYLSYFLPNFRRMVHLFAPFENIIGFIDDTLSNARFLGNLRAWRSYIATFWQFT